MGFPLTRFIEQAPLFLFPLSSGVGFLSGSWASVRSAAVSCQHHRSEIRHWGWAWGRARTVKGKEVRAGRG